MGIVLAAYIAIMLTPPLINAVIQDREHYRRWGHHLWRKNAS